MNCLRSSILRSKMNKTKIKLRFKCSILDLTLMFIISLLFSATNLPVASGENISESDRFLYLPVEDNAFPVRNSSIQIFDTLKNQLVTTIKNPDDVRTVILQLLHDKKDIFLQVGHLNSAVPAAIYHINSEKRTEKIMEDRNELIGYDDQYLYLSQHISNSEATGTTMAYKPTRLERRTKKIVEDHFDEDPDLNVVNIWEDDQLTWYACTVVLKERPRFNSMDNTIGPQGRQVLISKDKGDRKAGEI